MLLFSSTAAHKLHRNESPLLLNAIMKFNKVPWCQDIHHYLHQHRHVIKVKLSEIAPNYLTITLLGHLYAFFSIHRYYCLPVSIKQKFL